MRISMGGRGRAVDNIFIKHFCCTLKQDYVYLHSAGDERILFKGLRVFIDYYNNSRLHQGLSRLHWYRNLERPPEIMDKRKITWKGNLLISRITLLVILDINRTITWINMKNSTNKYQCVVWRMGSTLEDTIKKDFNWRFTLRTKENDYGRIKIFK